MRAAAIRPDLAPSGPAETRGRILIVDDEEVIASTLQEFLRGEGYEVGVAHDAPTALALAERFEPDLALCDVQLPGPDGLELLNRLLQVRPETLVMMITAYATVENAVAAFQRGAHDYLMKPVIFEELLSKIDRLMGYRQLLRENQALRRQLHAHVGLDSLVGQSGAMKGVKTLIRKIGPMRSNVLITGESGTGKELVARALHASGTEPDSAFLAINCAAIPHELLENQLFGHLRGAFTGADRDHAGLFVAAGGGTVFLDEVGELPLATQAKLLRAIETKEVLPVGATRAVGIGARIVAATNKPAWSRSAPVNAPRTWPKSPFSRSSCGIAAQLIARNAESGSVPDACKARATSSLPVPDSPVISTLLRIGPILRIRVLTPFIARLWPTRESRPTCACNCLRSA